MSKQVKNFWTWTRVDPARFAGAHEEHENTIGYVLVMLPREEPKDEIEAMMMDGVKHLGFWKLLAPDHVTLVAEYPYYCHEKAKAPTTWANEKIRNDRAATV